MKIVSRILVSALITAIIGFAFVYFMPGYNLYLVRSGSMTPAIKTGDLIITGPVNDPVSGELKPRTVITYERNKELVFHRIQSIDGEILVTQGDAVEDPDPWQVTLSDVRGIYLFKIPCVGYLTNFIRTKVGWFLMIIIPAALLVGWLVKDIVKEAISDA